MANYITPAGHARLVSDYKALFEVERPKIVEMVSWAAGNGDRSENGDYIYGCKRLREIDGALNRLSKKLKDAVVVDPAAQPDKSRIFFGATVTYVDEDDRERRVTLVGRDEADADAGRISWHSPVAMALKGASVGDVRVVMLPGGRQELEVLSIAYPQARSVIAGGRDDRFSTRERGRTFPPGPSSIRVALSSGESGSGRASRGHIPTAR